MANCEEGSKGIAPGGIVGLSVKECFDEFRCIGDKGLEMLIDGCNCPNRTLPYISVTIIQTLARGG